MGKPIDRALVILNPYSGRGHGAQARLELAQLLRDTRTHYDIVETERPGHAIDLALAARLEGYPMVVAAGGDGTVSEVVNGLMLANKRLIEEARTVAAAEAALQHSERQARREARRLATAASEQTVLEDPADGASAAAVGVLPHLGGISPESNQGEEEESDDEIEFAFTVPPELEFAGTLGVVPVGSGNDFASMVGIPLQMDAAVKLLERQRLRLVDVGSADVFPIAGEPFHRFFDNNMGIGLEASVTLESYKIRRLRGALLYAAAAIRALVKNRSPRMVINWQMENGDEGSHDRRTLLVSVGNSPRTGGGFYLTPDALVDDKALDVAIANDISKPEIMALLPRAMRGKHTGHPAVTMLRIQNLRIQVPEGAPVQMDGEVVCRDTREVSITIVPHKLEIIA